MMNYRAMTSSVLLAMSLLVGGLVLAAEQQPVGKVTIEEEQFGLVLGGSVGGGTLTFQSKEYPFKLKGLSVGLNVGVSKMSAVGEVYDMMEVSKFPGTYTKFEASVALGGGAGGLVHRGLWHQRTGADVVVRLAAGAADDGLDHCLSVLSAPLRTAHAAPLA